MGQPRARATAILGIRKGWASPPTVQDVYLRIIVHANEHMGQLVGYARMTGVVPPWAN
ncbi:MAG TPA: hypothetical protein VND65_20520 [Candidatus Binatia bacterium]|nr:hypothetical protein [Candidatus Binatia bacterium]